MLCDYVKYNPVKDLRPVSQTGFIDLPDAFANHNVPAGLPVEDLDYNGIEDPSAILGKPHDVFEAFDMEKSIRDAAASNENSDSANS